VLVLVVQGVGAGQHLMPACPLLTCTTTPGPVGKWGWEGGTKQGWCVCVCVCVPFKTCGVVGCVGACGDVLILEHVYMCDESLHDVCATSWKHKQLLGSPQP
jgi:hypothetical protein